MTDGSMCVTTEDTTNISDFNISEMKERINDNRTDHYQEEVQSFLIKLIQGGQILYQLDDYLLQVLKNMGDLNLSSTLFNPRTIVQYLDKQKDIISEIMKESNTLNSKQFKIMAKCLGEKVAQKKMKKYQL
jgi:hypothetical protein